MHSSTAMEFFISEKCGNLVHQLPRLFVHCREMNSSLRCGGSTALAMAAPDFGGLWLWQSQTV